MRRYLILTVFVLLAAGVCASPLASAQTSGASVVLLGNGRLTVETGPSDDLILIEAHSPNLVEVEVDSETWTFAADDVTALFVSSGDGNDNVIVHSQLPSWVLTRVDFDLGEGNRDGATVSASSYSITDFDLIVTGDVRSKGGSFGLRAGTETTASTLTVKGNVMAIGGPGDDSFGLETEFPKGTVEVNGNVRFIGGEGDDYAEFLINGTVVVDGDFTVLCQAGDDWVFLDGGSEGSGTVLGATKLFGGPGNDDWLDIGESFTSASLKVKQFEVCTGCP
jgi:hypothetical protein